MATSIYEFSQIPRVEAGPGRGERRPFVRDSGEAPRVGVIYNPRSHRNQGTDFDCGVSPLVHISQPSARAQLPQALEELAEQGLDLLVINGGDGTVRDVLTFGHAVFGDDWPMVAVLPKGKTNALTVDLGVPAEWTLQHAIDALEKGKSVRRRPIAIAPVDGASDHLKSPQVLGFILGAGAFTTAIRAGQSAHRLGAFNGVAVGVTALWGLAQSLFGGRGNPWRSGAPMKVKLGAAQTPLAHSGNGDPDMRQLLLASTLENLPTGVKAFGKLKAGLKLAVVDQVSRRTAALIPFGLAGHMETTLRKRGVHRLATPQFTLDIDDQFILDGEVFPAGHYRIEQGPELEFVTP